MNDSPEQSDQVWAARLAELREAEWKTSQRLLALGEEILKRAEAAIDEQKITLAVGVGLVQDASKFGRLAVEGIEEPPKPLDPREELAREIDARLAPVYGKEPTP
jgi:hypothetical protein